MRPGVFTIDLLPVGAYQIEAELAGFKKEVRSGITLAVDQVVRQTFVLQVGTTNEIVEVTSSSPLVQTDNASEHDQYVSCRVKGHGNKNRCGI